MVLTLSNNRILRILLCTLIILSLLLCSVPAVESHAVVPLASIPVVNYVAGALLVAAGVTFTTSDSITAAASDFISSLSKSRKDEIEIAAQSIASDVPYTYTPSIDMVYSVRQYMQTHTTAYGSLSVNNPFAFPFELEKNKRLFFYFDEHLNLVESNIDDCVDLSSLTVSDFPFSFRVLPGCAISLLQPYVETGLGGVEYNYVDFSFTNFVDATSISRTKQTNSFTGPLALVLFRNTADYLTVSLLWDVGQKDLCTYYDSAVTTIPSYANVGQRIDVPITFGASSTTLTCDPTFAPTGYNDLGEDVITAPLVGGAAIDIPAVEIADGVCDPSPLIGASADDVRDVTLNPAVPGTAVGDIDFPVTDSTDIAGDPTASQASWWFRIPILGDILRGISALFDLLKAGFLSIIDFLSNIIGAITTGFANLVNWLHNTLSNIPNLLQQILDAIKSLGGFLFNLGAYLVDILAFISGYTLFQNLFTHFLPASVAACLWAFWVLAVTIGIFRMVIDR